MARRTGQQEWNCPGCNPDSKLETPHLHSRTAADRLETAITSTLPPVPEIVWQQPLETSANYHKLDNIPNDSAIKTNQTTQEFENKQLTEKPS